MKLTVNITDNNNRVLKRQLMEYNLTHDTNMSLESFKELVFINGLLYMANGIDGRSKRNMSISYDVRSGEIIEYR